MSAIKRIREQIKSDGLKRGDTLKVGRRFGLAVQWEIMDRVPLTGDVAWVKANRPDFEHGNVLVDGARLEWGAQ